MKTTMAILLLNSVIFISIPKAVFAQAFGEYGRAVGSVPRRPAASPAAPGAGVSRGVESVGGAGDLISQRLPTRLVVVSKEAGLFSRQDDEMGRITQLVAGEKLVPLVQSEGTNPWYMVKTEKGIVGWVKAGDVRRDAPAKK